MGADPPRLGRGDARELQVEFRRTHTRLRLFESGLRGVDTKRAVAVDELWDDLTVRSARARLWPQTEFVKAAMILAEDAEPEIAEAYLTHAAQGAAALWGYLETEIPGLWRDKRQADGGYVDEPAPASSLYHIVGAILALTQWRAQNRT